MKDTHLPKVVLSFQLNDAFAGALYTRIAIIAKERQLDWMDYWMGLFRSFLN